MNRVKRVLETRPFPQSLLLLTLLGLVIRIPNLGRDSLWLDEAISFLAAELPIGQILNNTVQSSHPPLFYFLLSLWSPFASESDAALRGLTLFWGVLLIPLLGIVARDLLEDEQLGLLAALLIAVSPFHLLYSHELRMYTQLMFLVTLGTWLYWRLGERSGVTMWLAVGFVWLTAVYTHLFATLALIAINVHAFVQPERRPVFRRLFVLSATIAILFLPFLFTIVGESEQALGSLRPLNQPTVRNPIKPLTTPAFLLFGISNNLYISGGALFITLSLFVIWLLEWRKMRQTPSSALRLIGLQIGLVLGVPLLVYVIRPYFLPERTMAAAAPFLLLLLTWGVTRKKTPLPYLAIASVLLMMMATTLYHGGGWLKPPYRGMMTAVLEAYEPGDTIIHTSDGSYLPGLRYADVPNHILLAGDPDPRKPIEVYEAVGGEVWTKERVLEVDGRLWIIVALEHSVEWQQTQAAFFAERLQLIQQQEVGGILIYLYE